MTRHIAFARVLRLFLADLREAYGSVRGYAAQRLDADDHLITTLRHRLLNETPASLSSPRPHTRR